MKRFVQTCLRKFGIDVLSLSYSRQFLYDHHLREMFERHDVQTVLDIGAHYGRYGLFLRKIGFRGQIHSFEPVASTFAHLSGTARSDPHWHAYNFAFGETTTRAEMNIMAGSDLSSFLEYSKPSPKMTKVGTESVQIRTLDSFDVSLIEWSRTFIKIDTQGYDLAVLRGGEQTVRRVPLIQAELSVLPIYRDMPSHLQVINWLRQHGFDITGLFIVSRDSDLRAQEFDCVLVNRSFLHDGN